MSLTATNDPDPVRQLGIRARAIISSLAARRALESLMSVATTAPCDNCAMQRNTPTPWNR